MRDDGGDRDDADGRTRNEHAERALAALRRDLTAVLGRAPGRDENFFDAGLDSGGLVRVHTASTRDLDDPYPVTVLFAYPNLRAVHRFLSEGERNPRGRAAGIRGAGRSGTARRHLRQRLRDESERDDD